MIVIRILIIEDEAPLAEALSQILKKQNYTVDISPDGQSGLDNIQSGIYDLVLLDILLPEMDGMTVLKEVRKNKIKTPVILLTAKGEVRDRVTGLDCGADDYVAKPFAAEELLARIRAVTRRKGDIATDNIFVFGDIELNTASLKIIKGKRSVRVILKESELLELLISRKRAVTSKNMIIEKLWGYDSEADDNNVEVYISFLRKKLLFLDSKVSIITIRGSGYCLEVRLDCSKD